MKLANLSKILKCAGNDDAITMKSEDNGDTITFMFESPSEHALALLASLLFCGLRHGCRIGLGGHCYRTPWHDGVQRSWVVLVPQRTCTWYTWRTWGSLCVCPCHGHMLHPARYALSSLLKHLNRHELLQTRSGCPSLT